MTKTKGTMQFIIHISEKYGIDEISTCRIYLQSIQTWMAEQMFHAVCSSLCTTCSKGSLYQKYYSLLKLEEKVFLKRLSVAPHDDLALHCSAQQELQRYLRVGREADRLLIHCSPMDLLNCFRLQKIKIHYLKTNMMETVMSNRNSSHKMITWGNWR